MGPGPVGATPGPLPLSYPRPPPAGLGVGLGLVAAALLTRFLRAVLYEVAPLDWATFLLVPVVLLGVAACAVLIPAVRASRVAPVEALRME